MVVDVPLLAGLTRIGRGSNWKDFLPRDSYLLDFYSAEEEFFSAEGQLTFFTRDGPDLAVAAQREEMRQVACTWFAPPKGPKDRDHSGGHGAAAA